MISLPREFCLEAREGGKLTPGPAALTSPGRGGAVSQASYSPKASSLDFRNPLHSQLLKARSSTFFLLTIPGAPLDYPPK